MESSNDNNFWVFRDGRKTVSGERLLAELRRGMQASSNAGARSSDLLNTLIRAGELEAGLSDAASDAAPAVAAATDALAGRLYGAPERIAAVAHTLELTVPEHLDISPPEGFCYYALHPSDFGRLALRVGTRGRPAAVIGVRSIGTTLSAVVSAALRSARVPVHRITVRPTGHPYNRVLQFTGEQLSWVQERRAQGCTFFVVDEGPGRSGSTFLAVGEALLKVGVDVDRISLLGSRDPDLSQLCSNDAARRWSRFQFSAVEPDSHSRFRDFPYIGGGEWRRRFLADESVWPATWPQMERLKFLSPDGLRFWKFEGMGARGQEAFDCSRILAERGFGIEIEDGGGGFASYPVLQRTALRTEDLSTSMLERISEYCAFRAAEFGVPRTTPDLLSEMVTFNLQQEFGVDIHLEELNGHGCILADGHMQPHEWIPSKDGHVLKTDACAHGNDHFFPGPCDIAWDLAGAAVEWDFDSDATEHMLSRFQRLTGDDARSRFNWYAVAYSVFRLAWCKMAILTVQGDPEELRLRYEYRRYRARAHRELMKRAQVEQTKLLVRPNDSNAVRLAS
jgi:hypothetical protein